jgi:gliding motility-associated-like protein
MLPKFEVRISLCLLVTIALIFFSTASWAQLKADFTLDKIGGCSPLTITCTNTTTGASANATYSWNLGNGNTSTNSDGASAIYRIEKTYTIKLTVTDGGKTSEASKQITVYKKPTVDFTTSDVKGCAPFDVKFVSNSSAGDGSISDYFWDFGDGNVQKGNDYQQVNHTYNFAQKPTVALTVTNSYGCYTSLEKNLVEVKAPLKAAFSVNKPVYCDPSENVQFTNKTSGTGTLSYKWDFGDDQTSDDKDPSHVYGKKGTYPAVLKVANSDGCKSVSDTQQVNVANFNIDFDAPATVCQNADATFKDKSTPGSTGTIWQAEGQRFENVGANFTYKFKNAGEATVTLIDMYGGCAASTSKKITVNPGPAGGYTYNADGVCGTPVTIQFNDTSTNIVSRTWFFGTNGATSTDKQPTYTYNTDGYYTVGLVVTNDNGCSSTINKTLSLFKPYVSIGSDVFEGCAGLKVNFMTSAADQIATYNWNFGDGKQSTDKLPQHVFDSIGQFNVVLTYTTKGNCSGTANTIIYVREKPKADFTAPTDICGNSIVTFTNNTTGYASNFRWDFGDGSPTNPTSDYVTRHQYYDDKTYTVKLIAFNGQCSDTITRVDYIKVSPPFPKISGVKNTCDGTRGLVTFSQTSKKALTWSWDFGDGSPTVDLSTDQPNIQHEFTKTGKYKVVLTSTNGNCSVQDSVNAFVLLKQQPKLSLEQPEICASGTLKATLGNLEENPNPDYQGYNYYLYRWEYQDGTLANVVANYPTYPNAWKTGFTGDISGFDVTRKGLRLILSEANLGCTDTTNYVPLKIKGPTAAFNIKQDIVCLKSPVVFEDASTTSDNSPITKWEWDLGDGNKVTQTSKDALSYTYAQPGNYSVSLKVTDADGCSASTPLNYRGATVSGPQTDFSYYPEAVQPNTFVSFYNKIVNYPYLNGYKFKWTFTYDHSTDNSTYNPQKYYGKVGVDTVTLIATNITSGCSDTATKIIGIKYVTAAFDFTTAYLNNNSCPPLVATFSDKSQFANSISWDFGDGSVADNLSNPKHTYQSAGLYTVTLYAYGNNNYVDSSTQTIEVKGPYAILSADITYGCKQQKVTLSAIVKNATSYTWDFGDGNTVQTTDTFAVHAYNSVGAYTPSLLLKDGSNCASTSEIDTQIVIDSLSVGFSRSPVMLCDSGVVSFTPSVKSYSGDVMQQPLIYKWNFGTGVAKDTSVITNPQFDFNNLGKYAVSLDVKTLYGCEKEFKDSVVVVHRPKSIIDAPDYGCEDANILFKGSSDLQDVKWAWKFADGKDSSVQSPSHAYHTTGTYNVSLIVSKDGCSDSSNHVIVIHTSPKINLQPKDSTICLGKTIQLNAHDGSQFAWTPDVAQGNNSQASPNVSPLTTTLYKVKTTNEFGCTSTDSTLITVVQPFTLTVPSNPFVCKGSSIELPVSGAATYAWTGDGLNDLTSNHPIAMPIVTTTYTVTGTDAHHCFTSQSTITVDVKPLPTVNAGADIQLPTGNTVNLMATGSNDVVKWSWLPSLYLSCSNCASPVAAPRENMTYIVVGQTQFGCKASDTLNIKLVCSEGLFVPNAFTPNNDGKNDLFNVKGKGIKQIRHFQIFSRWGDIIFERSNFQIGDQNAAWDGKVNGNFVETGTYVYFVEAECDSGEIFTRKGTVVIIR